MTSEHDNTASTALTLMARHGEQAMPLIEGEIRASTDRADWDQVKSWCRVRLRVARLLMVRERASRWRSVYPDPARPAPVPWTGDAGRYPDPGPSAA